MPTLDPSELSRQAPIALSWVCVSNFERENAFRARLSLRNASGASIAAGWAIYFNTCRKIVPGSVGAGFVIEHVNGDLFRLGATGTLFDWLPDTLFTVDYEGQFWAISATDAPLGFYLVGADGGVSDLGDPVIGEFELARQRHRGTADIAPLADAAGRFMQNGAVQLLTPEQTGRITPRPLAAGFDGGSSMLTRQTPVDFPPALESEAALLRAILDTLPDGPAGQLRIVLKTGEVDEAAYPEAYRLDIGPQRILVQGASAHGVFNAIQSLRQLIDGGSVPHGQVHDAPRFGYRGLMLDVARHFASRDTVLRLLDCMALYKLNRFHFHLTDDEGWRFPVPALPELTQIGARRGMSRDGSACLPPSFGSGADVATSAGTGHYSADDMVAILRHAQALHIEVIPEFNLPGHARAAIVAMRARHDRLLAQGDVTGAQRFLLDDVEDRSVYESVQLWHDNVICIALPSVDRFIDTVVGALADLYKAAGVPLKTVHTGGDEVPEGAWLGSPVCQSLMARQGWHNVAQLRADFVARCHAILARHGVGYAGWEETALEHAHNGSRNGMVPSARFAGAGFQVYAWNNAWGSGQEDAAYRLANAGYQVVLANAANLYFDLACAKDAHEPGYYWAGFVGTRDTFAFCPLDAPATAGTDPMGRALAPHALAAMARLDAAGAARIAGLQGQLWGENARTRERIEYLAAPRLIALAERAWAPDPGWQHMAGPVLRAEALARDWNEFANRLGQRVLPQLDALLGFGYRLPPPGAVLTGGELHANVALPGLALHYTVDGSEPTTRSPRYREPVPLTGTTAVRIATFDTRGRKSRTVSIYLDTARDD